MPTRAAAFSGAPLFAGRLLCGLTAAGEGMLSAQTNFARTSLRSSRQGGRVVDPSQNLFGRPGLLPLLGGVSRKWAPAFRKAKPARF